MLHPRLAWILLSSFFVLQVLGQNSVQTFNWKFRTDFISTDLEACFSLGIVVFPNIRNATAGNYSGTPPYYMMAFPEGGQPITTHIGNDNNTLTWTPTHPIGTKLILQLVDSLGNTGGTSQSIFQVTPSTGSSDCFASSPPADFTITSNITQGGSLQTCQQWRLNINGGSPPYTLVLDAQNSPVLTNVTVPSGQDALVYVNRADPNVFLFANVVDSHGLWATGSQYVSTYGSTNTTCIGRGSITTTQAKLNQQEAAAKAAQDAKRRTSIIVGVVVSLGSLILIGGGVGAWLYMRKKKPKDFSDGEQDVIPRQFIESGSPGHVLSVSNFSESTTPSPGKLQFSQPDTRGLPYLIEPYTDSLSLDTTMISAGSASVHSPVSGADLHSRPSFANFPATSVRRSKAQAAAHDAMSESNSLPSGAGNPMWPVRSGSLQGNRLTATENELIYQHRDAGQVVRELPPPYIPPHSAGSSTLASEQRT